MYHFFAKRVIFIPSQEVLYLIYNYLNVTKPLEFNSIGKCEQSSENYIHRKSQLATFELIVVTDGQLCLKVANTKYTVVPGQYLLLQPDDINPTAPRNMLIGWKPSACNFYWMHFTCRNHSFITDIGPNDFIATDHSIYLPTQAKLLNPEKVLLLMRTLQDHRRSRLISLLDYGNYLTTLVLLEVYQQYRTQVFHSTDFSVSPDNVIHSPRLTSVQLYNDLTDYIHLHLNQNLKLQNIADYFGYSAKHLSIICKQNTGLSLKHYILKLKIDRASFLLLDTNLSIQEICSSLGFPDSHNFSRTFKQIVGMSPSEYRNSYGHRIINK